MQGFLALFILTFWLTLFPLNLSLIKKSFLVIFLLFHSIGYLIIFIKFYYFEKKQFFSWIIFIISALTLLYPWLSFSSQLFILSIIGILSPLMCIRCFSILLKEKGKLLPYTGIILGNLLSYLLQLFKLPPNLGLAINSLFLLGLYSIKTPLKFCESTQFKNLIRGKIYLFVSFFVFYFSSPFFYDWFFQNFSDFKVKIPLDLFFYIFGILFFLFWSKFFNNIKYLFCIPIFSFTLLSFGSITMHFDTFTFFLMTKFFVFSAIGIMDIFSLFLFVSYFSYLRVLSLVYVLITLGIALGTLFYDLFMPQERNYYLSYLNIIGLIGLLIYYKFYLTLESKRDSEEVPSSEEEIRGGSPINTEIIHTVSFQSEPFQGENNLTLEIFQKRLNESLPAHVKKLSKRESEVLFWYAIEEKNPTEISQILNISRSSVKEYLRRASLKLGVSIYELPKVIKNFFKE